VERKREAWFGHVISALAMITSLGLSVLGAIDPALGLAQVLFVVLAVLTEPAKIAFNRVIHNAVAATRGQRLLAFALYAICVAVSVGLTHLLIDRTVTTAISEADHRDAQESATVRAAEEALATRQAGVKALGDELRGLEEDLEAARSEVVPVPMTEAQIRARLASTLSRHERELANRDLAQLQTNARAEAKVQRLAAKHKQLKEKFEISRGEQSRAIAERSPSDSNPTVRNVRNVRGKLILFGLALALVLEALISGGVWRDAVMNRKHAPVDTTPTPEKDRSLAPNVANSRIASKDRSFEEALRKAWKSGKAKDGWLEGTQHSWAVQLGVSSGYVYRQLDRMVNAGLIEKKAGTKKTWVRFIQKPKLEIVSRN